MRRTTLRRTVSALAAPTLLVAVLSACGNDSGDGSDAAADTAQSSAGQKVDTATFVGDVVKGLKNATTSQVAVSVDHGSGDPLRADGQVDLTSDPVSFAMTATLPQMSEPVDVRLVDGVAYAKLGPMTNGKFVKYDLSDAKGLPDEMKALVDQVDAATALQKLGPALKSVTYVGDEEVDGTSTRHYVLAIDPSAVTALKDAPDTSKIPDEVSVDAWFDSDFLVRKLHTKVDAGSTPVELTATFSGWGEPVDISAPPASEVMAGRHMFGQMAG